MGLRSPTKLTVWSLSSFSGKARFPGSGSSRRTTLPVGVRPICYYFLSASSMASNTMHLHKPIFLDGLKISPARALWRYIYAGKCSTLGTPNWRRKVFLGYPFNVCGSCYHSATIYVQGPIFASRSCLRTCHRTLKAPSKVLYWTPQSLSSATS
jgi:hypothetical protein